MLTPLKLQRQREAIACFHHELELHHFLFAAVVYDIKIAIEKRLISSLLVGNICFGSFIRTIHTIATSVFRANSTHAYVHKHISESRYGGDHSKSDKLDKKWWKIAIEYDFIKLD